MTEDNRKRPWLAAALAFVYPGLGHMYVRSWHRALLWFGAVVITAVVFIPEAAFEHVEGVADVPAVIELIPTEARMALTLVLTLNVVDAYLTAKRSNVAVDGSRCDVCRRPVDDELTFCHWCTAELTSEHG